MTLVLCPYCGDRFDEEYYYEQHVPCPSSKDDGRHHRKDHERHNLKELRFEEEEDTDARTRAGRRARLRDLL